MTDKDGNEYLYAEYDTTMMKHMESLQLKRRDQV